MTTGAQIERLIKKEDWAAARLERVDHAPHAVEVSPHVEPALRRQLLPLLGDEEREGGLHLERELHDVRRARHLEAEARRGRAQDLDVALADVAAGRIRVHVASATPLSEANVRILIDMARERLQADCMLETAVQPEPLGGLVVTVGDTIYDGSLRGRLQRLRNTLMRSSGYEN